MVARRGRGAPRNRRRAPGGGARPADDGSRADRAAGDPARADRRRGRAPRHGAADPGRAQRGCRPPGRHLLGRDAPPARPRLGAGPRAAGAVPRRADHRPRPGFSRKAIWEEVEALNREGTTVFLTTQYLEEADQLADRVGIIARERSSPRAPPPRSRPRSASPHLEIGLSDGSRRAGRAGLRHLRRAICPSATARCWSSSTGARPRSRRSCGRSTRPGSRSSRSIWSSRRLDDVFVDKTGEHLEGDEPDADASSASRPGGSRAESARPPKPADAGAVEAQPARDRGARPALGAPDLPPAAAARADHRLPHPAARDPDRRRRRARSGSRASRR